MNLISPCCKATVQEGRRSTIYGAEHIEYCEYCNREVEYTIPACDCCGHTAMEFKPTPLGDYCPPCEKLYLEEMKGVSA